MTALETSPTRIDPVLMDIHMPGRMASATSQIRQLTESATLATVPVVALSAESRRPVGEAFLLEWMPTTPSRSPESPSEIRSRGAARFGSGSVLVVMTVRQSNSVVKLLDEGVEAMAVGDGQSAVVRSSWNVFR